MNTMTTTPAAYAGDALTAALDTTEQRIYEAAGDNGVVRPLRAALVIDPAASYTREQFSAMLNNAANEADDAVDYEDSNTIWAQDVRNLAVNCAGYLLEHPGASLDEIIVASWADLDSISWPGQYDATPDDQLPARGTPEHDAAIVDTVLSWVS